MASLWFITTVESSSELQQWKVMVILMYDSDGVILTHYLPPWQTILSITIHFGKQHATSFEKETATNSAEPTNL